MADIIQKAAEWGKHAAALRRAYPTVDALTDQRAGYHWQPKYDGVHAIIDTTSRRAFTREETPLPSIQHIVERLAGAHGPGFIFQGEIWNEGVAFKDISGAARRHALQPHLGVVLYDVHRCQDFDCGYDEPVIYSVRRGLLVSLHANFNGDPLIQLAQSFPANADTRPIGGWQVLAQEYVSRGGYDGLILRDMRAPWEAGPSRQGELIKIKPSVTLDLRCVGWSSKPGEKTGRDVVTLSVEYKGVPSSVGSGIPHDICPETAHTIIGQIVEVECMCVNPNNTLREPRFKAVRWDKTEAD